MAQPTSRRRRVLLAAFVVVVVAASLAVRAYSGWLDRSSPQPPAAAAELPPPLPPAQRPVPEPATLPEPRPIALSEVEIPCWACPEARSWPLQPRLDLDVLAPLGTGGANAAIWLADFSVDDGRRRGEIPATEKRALRFRGTTPLEVFAADEPLLREAEPWANQARMRFYPDLFALRGRDTEIPNLLFALRLAASWVARGDAATDSAFAMADYRRAVRWGRLLRQDDLTLIADYVGLTCQRLGLQAIADQARRDGDAHTAMLGALALSEIAPQRLLSAERLTRFELPRPPRWALRKWVVVPDRRLDQTIETAADSADRRLRTEAILQLSLVAAHGWGDARKRARAQLESLTRGPDPLVAELAQWELEHPPTLREVADLTAAP